MVAQNKYQDVKIEQGVPVIGSNSPQLNVNDMLLGSALGNNYDQAIFTRLIQSDPAFEALLNTEKSKMLRGLRKAGETGTVNIFDKDEEGNYVLEKAPKMSMAPMTAEPDDCCVVAGDLQVCKESVILKPLCLEKCWDGMERMMNTATAGNNSIVYQAYLGLLEGSGVPKKAYPTIEEFEQMSLISQFILLNILTFLNGVLEVEQNGNIIRRFNGLAEVYANPDVYTIDGSQGILEAFQDAVCRMNIVGRGRFNRGFFMADHIAFGAIESEIVRKTDGTYPAGWNVSQQSVTKDGTTYAEDVYTFLGIRIIKSDLLYVDEEELTGNIYYIPESMGIFSGIPLDMPAQFILDEWNKIDSPYIHWDRSKKAYPNCWSDCVSITNFGAVVNDLIAITNIKSRCDIKAYKGVEGMINIDALAPFVQ